MKGCEKLNKKIIVSVAIILVVVIAVATVIFLLPSPEQEELDFTVSGTSEPMNPVVPMVYVPFKTGADEQWNLTIECLEMPSLMSYVNILLYNGYWDKGKDFRSNSEDMYSIATELTTLEVIGVDPEALKEEYPSWQHLYNTTTYTGIYGSSTPQTFTVFFAFPSSSNGGVGKFHVKLEKVG